MRSGGQWHHLRAASPPPLCELAQREGRGCRALFQGAGPASCTSPVEWLCPRPLLSVTRPGGHRVPVRATQEHLSRATLALVLTPTLTWGRLPSLQYGGQGPMAQPVLEEAKKSLQINGVKEGRLGTHCHLLGGSDSGPSWSLSPLEPFPSTWSLLFWGMKSIFLPDKLSEDSSPRPGSAE